MNKKENEVGSGGYLQRLLEKMEEYTRQMTRRGVL
jgi:hypothetical protein